MVVRRIVKQGREADYEAWLGALTGRAHEFPGYLGTQILRPSDGNREYTSIYRFDSAAHLRDFEESDVRTRALAQVGELVEADPRIEKLTGLELWFSPPPGTVVPQPIRWRMILILVAVVFILGVTLAPLLRLVLAGAPDQVRLLLSAAIQVSLMTYVIMPLITRGLARWIYPTASDRT